MSKVRDEVRKGFEQKKILVEYIRDVNGHPIATVVATRNGVGIAVRNPKDPINKALGVKIAWDRAHDGFYSDKSQDKLPKDLLDDIWFVESRIVDRARRYFKELNFIN